MTSYLPEFLSLAVAHALAMASPGPDFAVVLKQSLARGRRSAVWTSVGIGCGLAVHITYCLLGLGALLRNSATVLLVVKYLGAAYLAGIGLQALLAKPRSGALELTGNAAAPTARASWTAGLLVNLLNPKAALSLLALFVLRVSPQTPKLIQIGYGLWMTVVTMAWFSFVAVVFTQPAVWRKFLRFGHWIDRALGVVLLAFALSLVLASRA